MLSNSPRKKARRASEPQNHGSKRTGFLLENPVKPMLATLVAKPFDRQGWIFEVKWDGYRAVAEVAQGQVKLYSRNAKSFLEKFAALADSLGQIGHDVVLDGEVVVLDDDGKSRFQLLQNYQKTGEGMLVYYVFDLLYLDGEDLRPLPLLSRKKLLAPLLRGFRDIRISGHVEESGVAFFQVAAEQGLEGIIGKESVSPYRDGVRGHAWVKMKARQRQQAVIGGFTEPRGSRQGLGALVLGVYDGDRFVYVGHAGGGFNDRSLMEMRRQLNLIIQKKCPFHVTPKTNTPARWVKPEIVCEVEFQEWTKEGSMRQPIFLGVRTDKSARAVHREIPVE